ncbi:MAG: ferric reductase-like transmembrane domain-containing protein [Betaproteobacteria bacterium]|nr:MAG: ferric reductase-like transmembrane domain-containing protein [Betaproteobacteria bacterium]
MRPANLIILYFALALAPLLLATGLIEGVGNPARLLATALGLLAFAMLLLQFVSSGRFEILYSKVGINRTMRFHQLTGRVAVLLVLLHPLLFFLPDSFADIPQALNMLRRMMLTNLILSGTIALCAVVVVVTAGIWRHKLSVRYEVWRAVKVVGVTIIAIAGAHHVFTVGSNSQALWLLTRKAYRVVSVREIGGGINEISLEPVKGRAIEFVAGQFAWVNFRGAVPVLDNPFSISSSPDELPRVRLLIKVRGDMSARVGELEPGATVCLDAPHGNFTLEGREGEAVYLIAGGNGISPIISILRDLAHKGDKRPISLVFGARRPQQLAYAEEIMAMANKLDLKVFFSVDEPPSDWVGGVGEFDAATIARNLPAEQRAVCA